MKTILTILFQFLIISAFSQVEISGTVTDQQAIPVYGANVFIQGTYDGATTDSLGHFSFKTSESGQQILIVSFVGYETAGNPLTIDADISELKIVLKESSSELDEVVINAGTFEANDKKKSVLLKPVDIALTASANGDVYGAFGTLPGAQKVGEEGRLFVRGGEAYETKTYMDGMLVNSPYYSKMPDIPTRGRFSPLLFNGAVFSTGGYSAEFGQALSSVVALNTTALEPEDKSSISILTVGLQGAHAKRWENTSLAVTGEFIHSGLTNRLFKQNIEWLEQPATTGTTTMFRHKTSETGMIKAFGSFSYNTSSLRYYNANELIFQDFSLKNNNVYLNTTYNELLAEKWMLNTGIAFSSDTENTEIGTGAIKTLNQGSHTKFSVTNFTSEKITTKGGIDFIHTDYRQEINIDGNFTLGFMNNLFAGYIESEIKISSAIAFRAGFRAEQNSLNKSANLAPRFSAAAKTGKSSQLSVAYGKFFQNPGNDYLKFNSGIEQEKATHSILTYQYKKGTKTFRMEAYNKNYTGLVKFKEEYSVEPGNYTNNGSGYSRGIDIFWRDKQSIEKYDYWISYSWNDTKRNYRDFPQKATPYFVSAHNLSIVYKRFLPRISTFAAVTYSFASGRPYYNPNNTEFMSDKTRPYNDISIGLTHMLYLFEKQAILHLIVNNIFGFENIYGYTYSEKPNNEGIYQAMPVTPSMKRMAVLLVSIQL